MYQHLELQTTYFLVGHKLYANLMGKIEPVKKHLEQLGKIYLYLIFRYEINLIFSFSCIDATSPYKNVFEGSLMKKGKLSSWKKYPYCFIIYDYYYYYYYFFD